MTDRHQHVLEPVALARVVVNAAGTDDVDAGALRQRDQRVVARPVTVDVVVL